MGMYVSSALVDSTKLKGVKKYILFWAVNFMNYLDDKGITD